MIKVTLPDGSERQFDDGASARDVAEAISKSLAKKAIAARVDGELYDLTRPLPGDAAVEIVTDRDDDALELIRHDCAQKAMNGFVELVLREVLAVFQPRANVVDQVLAHTAHVGQQVHDLCEVSVPHRNVAVVGVKHSSRPVGRPAPPSDLRLYRRRRWRDLRKKGSVPERDGGPPGPARVARARQSCRLLRRQLRRMLEDEHPAGCERPRAPRRSGNGGAATAMSTDPGAGSGE